MCRVDVLCQCRYGEAATSSARLYKEGNFGGNEKRLSATARAAGSSVIQLPYGFALFPNEIFWPPKSWTERSYTDIRRYSIMTRGGHFAAWEQPELMVNELCRYAACRARVECELWLKIAIHLFANSLEFCVSCHPDSLLKHQRGYYGFIGRLVGR